jgi:hypothetical protein
LNAMVRQWGKVAPVDFSKFDRLVIWVSCGAASTIAAKLAIQHAVESTIETVLAYCDPGSEHPDSARFLVDCETWLGHSVERLRSERYADTWAVWESRGYIAGLGGAPCTLELKKAVREKFERPGDLQVFGYDSTEAHRLHRFSVNQPEVAIWCPLIDANIPKALCFHMLDEAGIQLPAMYKLGYANNNCIGCPKGNAGYWNKIRRDFPDVFNRMAALERKLGAKLCQQTVDGQRERVHLDELLPDAGRYSDEPAMACGLFCNQEAA